MCLCVRARVFISWNLLLRPGFEPGVCFVPDLYDCKSFSIAGAAGGVQDWSNHLNEPQADNFWSDQNSENTRH